MRRGIGRRRPDAAGGRARRMSGRRSCGSLAAVGRSILAAFALTLLIGSGAAADILYKNATNPTGVPDFSQGAACLCYETAYSNGLWYFDQAGGKPGLVAHTNNVDVTQNWPADSQGLRDALAQQVSAPGVLDADWGVLKYIQAKRPQDITSETRIFNNVGAVTADYLGWSITRMATSTITNATLKTVAETPNQYGVLAVQWHEQGKPAGEFMTRMTRNSAGDLVPVKDAAGTPVQIGHELGVAGWDGAGQAVVVTNGWGDHHDQAGTPVSADYYNEYAFAQHTDPGNPKNNRLRITDGTLINGISGLEGRTPDYAEAYTLRVLDAQSKTKMAVKREKRPAGGAGAGPVPAGPGDKAHFDVLAFNEGGEAIYEVESEIPVLDRSSFSIGLLQNLDLPTGWTVELWNPNDDLAMFRPGSDDPTQGLGIYDFIGVRFSTQTAPIVANSGLAFGFELSADLVTADFESTALNLGAWNEDHDIQIVTVSGNDIPSPPTLALFVSGIGLLAGQRRRRRTENAAA